MNNFDTFTCSSMLVHTLKIYMLYIIMVHCRICSHVLSAWSWSKNPALWHSAFITTVRHVYSN